MAYSREEEGPEKVKVGPEVKVPMFTFAVSSKSDNDDCEVESIWPKGPSISSSPIPTSWSVDPWTGVSVDLPNGCANGESLGVAV